MKRDKNLICKLLQMLEAAATDRGFSFEEGEAATLKRPLDEINYNLEQAEQMGLIEVLSKPLHGKWTIRRLTPRGHDFLEHSHNTEQNRFASGSRKMAGIGLHRLGIGALDPLEGLGGLPPALDDAVTTKPPIPAKESAPREHRPIVDEKRPELVTLKPGAIGMSVDLKELFRRWITFWKGER